MFFASLFPKHNHLNMPALITFPADKIKELVKHAKNLGVLKFYSNSRDGAYFTCPCHQDEEERRVYSFEVNEDSSPEDKLKYLESGWRGGDDSVGDFPIKGYLDVDEMYPGGLLSLCVDNCFPGIVLPTMVAVNPNRRKK
jgi:hypothetical protein